jgi:AraC-like DNA-binding protein
VTRTEDDEIAFSSAGSLTLTASPGVEKAYVAQVFDFYQPRGLDTLKAFNLGELAEELGMDAATLSCELREELLLPLLPSSRRSRYRHRHAAAAAQARDQRCYNCVTKVNVTATMLLQLLQRRRRVEAAAAAVHWLSLLSFSQG